MLGVVPPGTHAHWGQVDGEQGDDDRSALCSHVRRRDEEWEERSAAGGGILIGIVTLPRRGGGRSALKRLACGSRVMLCILSLAACMTVSGISPSAGHAASHAAAAPMMKPREDPMAKPKLKRSTPRDDLAKAAFEPAFEPALRKNVAAVGNRRASLGLLAPSSEGGDKEEAASTKKAEQKSPKEPGVSFRSGLEKIDVMVEEEEERVRSPGKGEKDGLYGAATGTISGGVIDNGWDGSLEGYVRQPCSSRGTPLHPRTPHRGHTPAPAQPIVCVHVCTTAPPLLSSSALEVRENSKGPETFFLIQRPPPPSAPRLQNPATTGLHMRLESAWASLPHPVKAYRGGEDVRMAVNVGQVSLIGVFDGVGGWADHGIDPALYAREMAYVIERELSLQPDICSQHEKPLVILLETVEHPPPPPRSPAPRGEAPPPFSLRLSPLHSLWDADVSRPRRSKAYNDLEARGRKGSCTVCLALITGDGQLHVLNLGDSGLHVVRDGLSLFCTNEQQHYFNCPFQLGMGSDDSPYDADYYIITDIAADDVLVLATDGVWDNVYEEDIMRLVIEGRRSPRKIAGHISRLSQRQGRDGSYMSPFAFSASQQGLSYTGGKLDDVTVVVARVTVGGGGGEERKGESVAALGPGEEFISPVSSEEIGLEGEEGESLEEAKGGKVTNDGQEPGPSSYRDYIRWLGKRW